MNADLFIAHNAVPEGATGVERQLHMPPSVIGQIAAEAHVKNLVCLIACCAHWGRKPRPKPKSGNATQARSRLRMTSTVSP